MANWVTKEAAKEYGDKALNYFTSGNFTLAIEEVSRGISLDPEYWYGYFIRGQSYYRLGKNKEARSDLSYYYYNTAHAESKQIAWETMSKIDSVLKAEEKEAREAAEKKAREAKEAAEKLRTAAEQGDINAQFNLGNLYFNGNTGIPQDYAKAIEWFGKAAAQGHTEAKDRLAKAEATVKKAAKKKILKKILAPIGLVLQLGVTAAVFFLFFSGLLDPILESESLPALLLFLPVGVPALVIGIISLLFRKGSGFSTGMCLIILIDIVMTIYITISEEGGVVSGIMMLIGLSITAIPGFCMTSTELK